jgi:type II secretory pathway predicted ATPase ExeA
MHNNRTIDGGQPRVYEQFYGFRERPFFLQPDPDFLYLSEKHRTTLDLLELAIFNQSGFCVISGDIGVGKTTLVRELLNRLDDNICVGLVTNTLPSFGELLQLIMAAFGLECDTDDNFELHKRFTDFLIQQYADQKHTLLIIDEAQHLSLAALEKLRMLSNINADKDFLLQVILVGQKNLHDKLTRPELEQFSQRIAVDYHLTGLDEKETHEYIRYRLSHAGGSPDLFDKNACSTIYHCSEGIPRLINRICGVCLVYGYSEESQVITSELAAAVARDQRIGNIDEISDSLSQRGADAYTKVVEPNTDDKAGYTDSSNNTALDAPQKTTGATRHEIEKPAPEDTTEAPKESVTGYGGDTPDMPADHAPAGEVAEAISPDRQTVSDNDSPVFPVHQVLVPEQQQNNSAPGKQPGAAWVLSVLVAVAGVGGWLIWNNQNATPDVDSVTAEPSVQPPSTAIQLDESEPGPAHADAAIPAQRKTERELAQQREAERLEQQRQQAEQELAAQRETERLEQQRQQAEQALAEQRKVQRLEQQRRQAEQKLAEQRKAQRLEQQRRQAEHELTEQPVAQEQKAVLADDNQLEARRAAAKAAWKKWSNTNEWSDESGGNVNEAYEARRAAAKAAWSKWRNTGEWSEESGDDSE